MTITVVASDLIEHNRVSLSASGLEAIKGFYVTTTAGETPFQILQDASTPDYGDAHPDTGGSGEFPPIYAVEFDLSPIERQSGQYLLIVTYRDPDPAERAPSTSADDAIMTIGSTVVPVRTNYDKNGDPIIVTLSTLPAAEQDQIAEVETQIPVMTLTYRRRESAHPATKTKANVGYVNSVALGSGFFPVRTLLCTGIHGETQDGGTTYLVTYEFQYNPDTWDATSVYIDPNTDRPHVEVSLSSPVDGVSVDEVLPTVDFSSLNLNFPS